MTEVINRLINRRIHKILASLGDTVAPIIQKSIKQHLRWLEADLLKEYDNITENGQDFNKRTKGNEQNFNSRE